MKRWGQRKKEEEKSVIATKNEPMSYETCPSNALALHAESSA